MEIVKPTSDFEANKDYHRAWTHSSPYIPHVSGSVARAIMDEALHNYQCVASGQNLFFADAGLHHFMAVLLEEHNNIDDPSPHAWRAELLVHKTSLEARVILFAENTLVGHIVPMDKSVLVSEPMSLAAAHMLWFRVLPILVNMHQIVSVQQRSPNISQRELQMLQADFMLSTVENFKLKHKDRVDWYMHIGEAATLSATHHPGKTDKDEVPVFI